MGKRQTFLSEPAPTGSGEKRHLNVVVSEEDSEGLCLVVPITTFREENTNPRAEQNNSCIIEKDEHPFIDRKSWVQMARARSMSAKEIKSGIETATLKARPDISADVLQRIQEKVKTSIYLKERLKHFRNLL
jgi:uncharacterized protein YifN (PemK superfamily)